VRAVQRLEPFTSISEGTLLGIEEIGIPGRSTSPVVRGMVNVRSGQARRSVRAQQPSYSFAEVHIQYVLGRERASGAHVPSPRQPSTQHESLSGSAVKLWLEERFSALPGEPSTRTSTLPFCFVQISSRPRTSKNPSLRSTCYKPTPEVSHPYPHPPSSQYSYETLFHRSSLRPRFGTLPPTTADTSDSTSG